MRAKRFTSKILVDLKAPAAAGFCQAAPFISSRTLKSASIAIVGLLIAHSAMSVRAVDPVSPKVTLTKSKDPKVIFQTVCAQCHGAAGEGREDLKSPSIASLPSWYLVSQFTNFRGDRRGHDAADTQAFMMATIAKSLEPQQVKAVATHVAKMPSVVPEGKARDVQDANPESGMKIFQEFCMECHRYNGSGELAFGSPPLVGLQGWYLEAQLKKFKAGKRGAIKGDVNGTKMAEVMDTYITDDRMVRDLVAYIMTLNPPPVSRRTDGN